MRSTSSSSRVPIALLTVILVLVLGLLPGCSEQPTSPEIVYVTPEDDVPSVEELRKAIPSGATFFSVYFEQGTAFRIYDAVARPGDTIVISRMDYSLDGATHRFDFMESSAAGGATVARYRLPTRWSGTLNGIYFFGQIDDNLLFGGLTYPYGTGQNEVYEVILQGQPGDFVTLYGYTY